jgi:hypothetical protein
MKLFNFTLGVSGLDRATVDKHFDGSEVVLHHKDLIFLEFEVKGHELKSVVCEKNAEVEKVGGVVEQVWLPA